MSLYSEFVGRGRALAEIGRWFDEVTETGRGRMVSVRGRRQVGKSTLYTEFIGRVGTPHVFFTGIKGGDERVQLDEFRLRALESEPPLPDATTLFAGSIDSWRDAFGRVQLAARTGPVVVVLDEFPWATEHDPTLEGVLQAAWDRDLSQLPILLVLIGSDVAMMERITEYGRPLYGRAQESVISPLNPAEVAEATGSDAWEAFDAYLVTGGYPRLVTALGTSHSAATFVRAQLEDETSALVALGERAIDAEFHPDTQARRVLAAIGADETGHQSFTTVLGRIGGDSASSKTAITRALKVLRDQKGVVAMDIPAGASANSKLRRYRIDDPYLRFWFRFVGPQVANISRGRGDLAAAAFDQGWETWRGKAIEPIVRDALFRLAPNVGLDSVTEVGAWWDRKNTVEVDIAATDKKGIVALGSIKWRARKQFGKGDLDALLGAQAVVPHATDARLLVVSPAGVASGVVADAVFHADHLMAAWS